MAAPGQVCPMDLYGWQTCSDLSSALYLAPGMKNQCLQSINRKLGIVTSDHASRAATQSDRVMFPDHLSVLVVDDNTFTRKLVRSMLRQVPVPEIVDLDSADDALTLMRSRHFDAVLMDWFMPGMGGEAFLMSVADMRSPGWVTPPILIMTAHAKRRVVLKAARLGAQGVLAKPLSVAILRSRIHNVLYGSATADRHDGTGRVKDGDENAPLDVDLDPGQILL